METNEGQAGGERNTDFSERIADLMKSKTETRNLIIPLIAALLLALNGCGEKASDNKTEAAASAVPGVTAKKFTSEKKFAEMKRKAEAGDAKAQRNLAMMYGRGDGVPNDDAKAMEWWQKAAAQGNADAQIFLGWMYYSGNGIPKDAAKALEWYQKAAAQGDVDAQLNLGMMYANGEGVPKDFAKAMEWWRKAAAQGDVMAQVFLGEAYLNDDDVPKDGTKATEAQDLARKCTANKFKAC